MTDVHPRSSGRSSLTFRIGIAIVASGLALGSASAAILVGALSEIRL